MPLLRRSVGLWIGLTVWAAACGAPADDPAGEGIPPGAAAAERASALLGALLDSAWARDLETSPIIRLREGLDVERLPNLGYEEAEDRAAFFQRQLDRALAIDGAALSAEERVTLETVRRQAEIAVEGHRYFWLRSVLTPYSSVLRSYSQIFPLLPLEDEEDLDRFVSLVERVPSHVRDLEGYVRGQFERDFIVSSQNLAPVIQLVRATAGEAEGGPFALPADRAAGLDPDRVAEARARIGEIVRDSINPALEELAAFLEGPYTARAPAGVGLSQYPEGRDYYLYLTRLHTTMEVTPAEAQAAGHELLAEFRRRMADIRDRLGSEGSAESFHEHLKTDPRYFPTSFLGFEAGVYEDLYSEYGFYILESFLATRLVVDPGMNYFSMTREEARQFMRENTLESETRIATESLRYSTDLPGQALAYQMGKRKLLELRARAEDALGDGFDIRGFHDVVLRNGSVPMVVLEGQVDAWIDAEGGGR
ncbi:DUF885 domain-containing protein [Candidatus Palauibacter sp.]|uniref:DUF885 domain-containing protein n=1 Tax=Candidatus Palauibacter sp. TaxID=3101350 RepID=UPI003AF2E941